MSRELKFRVWEEREKTYNTWSYILDTIGNLFRDVFGTLICCDEKDYILEQYTGLKDRNGKEIYEGDIIREKWYDNDVNRGRDRIGKIEYFCDRFVCWFGGNFVNLGMFPSENIEVIGNIHENPELLEN